MTAFEELLQYIQSKNSHGKNELILALALILAKHNTDSK